MLGRRPHMFGGRAASFYGLNNIISIKHVNLFGTYKSNV